MLEPSITKLAKRVYIFNAWKNVKNQFPFKWKKASLKPLEIRPCVIYKVHFLSKINYVCVCVILTRFGRSKNWKRKEIYKSITRHYICRESNTLNKSLKEVIQKSLNTYMRIKIHLKDLNNIFALHYISEHSGIRFLLFRKDFTKMTKWVFQ